jgi:hypothetical protein
MLHLDRRIDVVADTLDSGRRKLASLDLGNMGESALVAARAVVPDTGSRPKSHRRWPFVGAVVVIGATIAGWIFLVPKLRRMKLDAAPTADESDAPGAALTGLAAEAPSA